MHKIGVLDSGIGGLTICSYIFEVMPDANAIYYADTENAPYGNKTKDEVYRFVRQGVAYLVDSGCDVIVVACNTATTSCVSKLRWEFSVPIVGTEPQLKTAYDSCETPLLLATPLTYENEKEKTFRTADTTMLSSVSESAVFYEDVLKKIAARLVSENEKEVVLGCTHYLYLEKFFSAKVYDGGRGVANRTKTLFCEKYRKNKRGGNLFLCFSGKKYFAKYERAFENFDNFNRNRT